VVVVGNLIVGGAGKTPTVMAVVDLLKGHGLHPGVISRGHGRRASDVREVGADSQASEVGDEPLLIHRRTGVPCWVGRDRPEVGCGLLAAHPEVDVLVSDDGLQHLRLKRDIEIIVFDERGAGNGLVLPAGPLREDLPERLSDHGLVLYNAAGPSTRLPGELLQRSLGDAVPLQSWLARKDAGRVPLADLRGRRLLAVAGIAAPERFFAALEAAGLSIDRLALPDHHDFATLPWSDQDSEVLVTEKDAVKLDASRAGGSRVWVVGLDFVLPPASCRRLLQLLGHEDHP
jgi:tetraacyldisaccharide 4'-kinase